MRPSLNFLAPTLLTLSLALAGCVLQLRVDVPGLPANFVRL